MKKTPLVASVVVVLMCVAQAVAQPQTVHTPEAHEAKKKNPALVFSHLKAPGKAELEVLHKWAKFHAYDYVVEPDGRILLKVYWEHNGHNPKTGPERDSMAARWLFVAAQNLANDWNNDFEVSSIKFAGVNFIRQEAPGSTTEGSNWGSSRKYKALGWATGYVLFK